MTLICTCGEKVDHFDFSCHGKPTHLCQQGGHVGHGCNSNHTYNMETGQFECRKGGTVVETTLGSVEAEIRNQLLPCVGHCMHVEAGHRHDV